MDTYYKVLSIAGSDCSGGAGIQADLKTCSAIGTYAMTVITAITAQNTMGVTGIMNASPEIVSQQIDAIFHDIRPDAVKIGMLSNHEIIETVADRLTHHAPRYIVLDPVMVSTSGSKLIDDDAINTLVTRLFPISTLVTPNKYEAELLSGIKIESPYDIKKAGCKILALGAKATLIKGGHFDDENMTDYLFENTGNRQPIEFKSQHIATYNSHGTGCSFSSAIASYIALGHDLHDAIYEAKKFLTNALAAGADIAIGKGHGAINHFFAPTPLKIHRS